MHLATIRKINDRQFQVIFLFEHMVGPQYCDAFPSRYTATKYIDKVTDNKRKIISLNKLYEEQENRISKAYYEYKNQTEG